MKKITALLLALSVVSALFASCADTREAPEDTAVPAVTETDAATDETEKQPEDPGPEETFTIYENGKFSCVIVYPENDSDLIRKSATAISAELGKITGGLGPLAFPDGTFNEEKYADRCIILVGKTGVAGTEGFEASSVYGEVSAKLIGGKYQINIHDETDAEAFIGKMRELAGESPEKITIDRSWNFTVPTADGIAAKIIKLDGGHNGALTENSDGSVTKNFWCHGEDIIERYVEKCVSSGFSVYSEAGNGHNGVTVLEGNGVFLVVTSNADNYETAITVYPAEAADLCVLDASGYGEDYGKWVSYAEAYCEAMDADILITDDSSYLSWWVAYVVNAFFRAYCATDDIRYLTKMADTLYGVYLLAEDHNGDGYRNWGVCDKYDGVGYNEFVCHSGAIAGAAADLLNLLAGKPSLNSAMSEKYGISFGEMAEYIKKVTVEGIIPTFDRDWSDRYGVYMNRLTFPAGGDPDSGETLPHNQYLMMAYALLEMSKLDIGAERAANYRERARTMLSVFSSWVRRLDNGTVVWNYSDLVGENDSYVSTEDSSHGILDIRTVVAAYNEGEVFGASDLEAFCRTYSDAAGYDPAPFITPRLYSDVDGSGVPGISYNRYLYDLSVFSGEYKIWDRGRRYALREYEDPGQAEDSLRIMAYHPGAPEPEAFSLTSPADGGGNVSPDSAVFRWENSVHAAEYTLTVAKDSSFEDTVLVRDRITGTSALVTDVLEAGTEYFWKVTAKTTGGKETESGAYSFRTK